MRKADEIAMLECLIGDTYFNDTFSTDEIRIMQNNIKNDFPLLLNTKWERPETELQMFKDVYQGGMP